MEGNDGSKKDHPPLQGAVICCTSIPPEERFHMAQIAQEMGAVHKLDLTSDVTHLIVGNIDTPKYKYTAKERQDIKVLHPAWLEAVRDSWITGGETDVGALENEHELPTFFGLRICVTGFSDPEQRMGLQDAITGNGATYHGDLTKEVSHLITAAPVGKKYEYATQWGIKVVAMEWFQDSLQRGMALEERFYHPLLPIKERGVGAVIIKKAVSPLGKRARQETQAGEPGRRKLRRTASSKLESQNDDLWADLGQNNDDANSANKESQFSDGSSFLRVEQRGGVESAPVPQTSDLFPPTSEATSGAQERSGSIQRAVQIFNPSGGEDTGQRIYVHGFDARKTEILHKFLVANGAIVIPEGEISGTSQKNDCITIVPYNMSVEELEDDEAIEGTELLTDMWVEKCLHRKTLVDRSTPLCVPFWHGPITGFEKLKICPTSFTGIDLLHLSKAAKLLGATYDEYLRAETSVLVCNETAINQEKLNYAVGRSIPIVSPRWLWSCLLERRLLPFQDFGLSGSRNTQHVNTPCFYHPLKNPRARNHTRPAKLSRRGTNQLELSAPSPPRNVRSQNERCSKEQDTNGETDPTPLPPATATATATTTVSPQPLRQLSQPTNSPRKPARSQTPIQEDDWENNLIPNPEQQRRETSPSTPPPAPAPSQPNDNNHDKRSPKNPKSPTKPPSPSQTTKVNTAIAALLSEHQQRLLAATSALNNDKHKSAVGEKPNATDPSHATSAPPPPTRLQPRRHRPLGRASSNPWSLGPALPLSRTSSVATTTTVVEDCENSHESNYDDDEIDTLNPVIPVKEIWQPSQVVGYEDPEGMGLREKLMRVAGGGGWGVDGAYDVDGGGAAAGAGDGDSADGRGLRRVERIGVVQDVVVGVEGGRRRGRRR